MRVSAEEEYKGSVQIRVTRITLTSHSHSLPPVPPDPVTTNFPAKTPMLVMISVVEALLKTPLCLRYGIDGRTRVQKKTPSPPQTAKASSERRKRTSNTLGES